MGGGGGGGFPPLSMGSSLCSFKEAARSLKEAAHVPSRKQLREAAHVPSRKRSSCSFKEAAHVPSRKQLMFPQGSSSCSFKDRSSSCSFKEAAHVPSRKQLMIVALQLGHEHLLIAQHTEHSRHKL